MKLFTGFEERKDAEGRSVIELRAPIGYVLIAAVAGPLVLMAGTYYATKDFQMPIPWWVYTLIALFGGIGAKIVYWMGLVSQFAVTVDRGRGRFLVGRRGEPFELAITEVAKVAIETTADSEGAQVSRLVFIRRDGGKVPATRAYFNFYRGSDLQRVVAALNRELGERSKML